jgi:hypothetical protein
VQPFKIESNQVEELEAFLETLNGAALPEELTAQPSSPAYSE